MRSNSAHKIQPAHFDVAVEEMRAHPGAWTVEAIDTVGDGAIYQAIFAGPDAKGRADEYARFKYGAA
jgi:hypothetical protein